MSTATAIQDARTIEHEAREAFTTLARRAANDETISADAINVACRAASKSVEEFARLVAILKSRAKQRVRAARREPIERRVVEIERAIEAAGIELEAAVETHRNAVSPLHAERQDLLTESLQISNLPQELANTCPDERLHAEHRRLRTQDNVFRGQKFEASHAVSRLRAQFRDLPADDSERPRSQAAVEKAEAALAAIDEQIRENMRRIEDNFRARVAF